jgi:Domain of unknown function (DUF4105)
MFSFKKYILLLLTGTLFFTKLHAQTDSCGLRISLLTCNPGAELYSTFGHSALRVVNVKTGTDIVYNYGTFDFNDPDFYTKFVKGKLLYYLNTESFNDFMYSYQADGRSVQEQVLNNSCADNIKILQALQLNLQPQNKFYKYDFTDDNCTTRLRDLIQKNVTGGTITKPFLQQNKFSYRNLIHQYLDSNNQLWSKLGIDILLGSPLDKKVSTQTAMFLPHHLLTGLDSTTVRTKPLVLQKTTILIVQPPLQQKNIFTPFLSFLLLFIFIALLSFIKNNTVQKMLFVFDNVFFFICGALGCLLIFMWAGTDHQTCKNNFNLLWAIPTHIIAPYFLSSKKIAGKKYFQATFVMSILLCLLWFFLPQQLNVALFTVNALLALRSFFILKNKYSHA